MSKFKYVFSIFFMIVMSLGIVSCGADDVQEYIYYTGNINTYFINVKMPLISECNENIVIELGQLNSCYSQCTNFEIYIDDNVCDVQNSENGYIVSLQADKIKDISNLNITAKNINFNMYNVNLYDSITKDNIIESKQYRYGTNFHDIKFDTTKIPHKIGYDEYYIQPIKESEHSNLKNDFDYYVDYRINKYMVEFYSDQSMDTQIYWEYIEHGESLTDVVTPQKITGKKFIGWSQSIENIQSDLKVYPMYQDLLKVWLYDFEGGNVINFDYVDYGDDYTLSTTPTLWGLEFDGIDGNTTNIQQNTTFVAKWTTKTLTTTFNLKESEYFSQPSNEIQTFDILDIYNNNYEIIKPERTDCYFDTFIPVNYPASVTLDINYLKSNAEKQQDGNFEIELTPRFIDYSYNYNVYEIFEDTNNKQWLKLTYFIKLKNHTTFEVPSQIWDGDRYLPVYGVFCDNQNQIHATIIDVDCYHVNFYFAYYCTDLTKIIIGENVTYMEKYQFGSENQFNTSNCVEIIFEGNTVLGVYSTFKGIDEYIIYIPATANIQQWKNEYGQNIATY